MRIVAIRREEGAGDIVSGPLHFELGSVCRKNGAELRMSVHPRLAVHGSNPEVVNHPALIPPAFVIDDEQTRHVREDVNERFRIVGISR